MPLSGGETITIRKRLTAGEARERVERWTKVVTDPQTGVTILEQIPTRRRLATVTAYLLDWTLTDDAGRLVDLRAAATIAELETILENNLEPEAFHEIGETIEAHEVAMIAEREAQKKTAGPSASPTISQSLAAVAGGTNG